MPALSSRKVEIYEFLKGEKILRPDQKRVIGQAKFTFSPLGKTFEKQNKKQKKKQKNEEQGKKQIDAITNQIKKISGFN